MYQPLASRQGFFKLPPTVWQIAGAAAIYVVVSGAILRANPDLDVRFRLSLEPILSAAPVIQLHVGAALTTFALGLLLLLAPKGFRLHRTAGWLWVACMAVTAISSFFITGLMGRSYSPIHALSAWVMIALPFGLAAARRRDIERHRKEMTGMFVGGMVVAGLFSFLPGRLMWRMFFAA